MQNISWWKIFKLLISNLRKLVRKVSEWTLEDLVDVPAGYKDLMDVPAGYKQHTFKRYLDWDNLHYSQRPLFRQHFLHFRLLDGSLKVQTKKTVKRNMNHVFRQHEKASHLKKEKISKTKSKPKSRFTKRAIESKHKATIKNRRILIILLLSFWLLLRYPTLQKICQIETVNIRCWSEKGSHYVNNSAFIPRCPKSIIICEIINVIKQH